MRTVYILYYVTIGIVIALFLCCNDLMLRCAVSALIAVGARPWLKWLQNNMHNQQRIETSKIRVKAILRALQSESDARALLLNDLHTPTTAPEHGDHLEASRKEQ